MPDVNTLILLVGANPLPNYLAAATLKPDRVVLVHSPDTEQPAKRLKRAIEEDFHVSAENIRSECVAHPHAASLVEEAMRKAMPRSNGIHLNYTGGTKVMSAHAVQVFYQHSGSDAASHASYVDERNRCLRFDNGNKRTFDEHTPPLTFSRVLQLHGVDWTPRSEVEGGPTVNDADAIVTAICKDPSLVKKLYDERTRLQALKTPANAATDPCRPSNHGLQLTASQIPDEGWSKKQFEAWYKFIGGEWLEEWVRNRIQELGLNGIDADSVVCGVNCKRETSKRQFEIDLALVRHHRTYAVSCTTDSTIGLCKSKAFEISVRAPQMAGDLARSAVVCLLDSGDRSGVAQLQADLDDAWGSPNATRVFGLEDVRQWAGFYGEPNLSSLKDWLDS